MRPSLSAFALAAVWSDLCAQARAGANAADPQHPLATPTDAPIRETPVSVRLFSSLERLARLVDISYCVGTTGVSPPFSCVSRCSEFPSLDLVTTWNTGMLLSDSCGFIAVDHGEPLPGGVPQDNRAANSSRSIIVAFRGTYSITNTVVDLSTTPQEYVPYPEPDDDDDDGNEPPEHQHHCTNCTVHMGFLASWRSARTLVLPALKKARAAHPDYPVHLVGHSLGGAVAALAALELRVALRWDDVRVTTFGEPRVGNKGLAGFIDRVFDMDGDGGDDDPEHRQYRRVTHANDPVPLLPLTEWGYRSHGGEVFIAKADLQPAPEDLRLCRGDEDPGCSAGAESESDVTFVADVLREAATRDVAALARHLAKFPARLKLWQLFFAHRDYFWRLGLCVPGGDPSDWGRGRYNYTTVDKAADEEL